MDYANHLHNRNDYSIIFIIKAHLVKGGIVPQDQQPGYNKGFDKQEFALFAIGVKKSFRQYNCFVVNSKVCTNILNYDKPIITIILN